MKYLITYSILVLPTRNFGMDSIVTNIEPVDWLICFKHVFGNDDERFGIVNVQRLDHDSLVLDASEHFVCHDRAFLEVLGELKLEQARLA